MSHSSAHLLASVILVLGGPRFRSRIGARARSAMQDELKGRDSGWLRRRSSICAARQRLTHGVSIVLASCLLFPSVAVAAADSLWQKSVQEGKQLREEGH